MLNSSQPNKFHGNISEDLTLANIFEQIAANQKYGWVFLKYSQQEVCLYFQGDLVGLVTPPEKKLEYIPEKLYHAGMLSEEDYQSVIASDDPLSTLEEKLAQDEITSMLNNICYDEICSLLSRYEGYFEFIDQNHPEANAELTPIGRMFDSEGILIEAANRHREWTAIKAMLPDWDEILVTTESGVTYEPDDPMGNILSLANNRSLREIVLYSYFGEFDTIRMVSSLINDGNLRPLTEQELKSFATEYEAKEDWDTAIGYYQVLFRRLPGDLGICEALTGCYEKTERSDELAVLCEAISQQLLASPNKRERTQGGLYLKKFADLVPETPEETEARLQLFDLVIRQLIDAKAIEYNIMIEGNKLFLLLRSRKEDHKARQVLENLLGIAPHDKNLQSMYINVCLDLKDFTSAVTQYETMAKIYERDHNWTELADVYQKIIRLIPDRKDIIKKLEDLRTKKLSKSGLLFKVAAILAVLTLAGGSWFGYKHYQKSHKTEKTEAPEKVEPEDVAKKAMEDYQKMMNEQALRLSERAKMARLKGKIAKARELIEQACDKQPDSDVKLAVEAEKREIDKFKDDFDKKMKEIREIRDRSWKSAIRKYHYNILLNKKSVDNPDLYRELIDGDPFYIPVSFQINPASARSSLRFEIIGGSIPDKKKRLLIDKDESRLQIDPEFTAIVMSVDGYEAYRFYNPFLTNSPRKGKPLTEKLVIDLVKKMQWSSNLDESIGAPGVYSNGVLYLVSGSSGKIYAFENFQTVSSPRRKWTTKIKERGKFLSFATMPCLFQDTLYAVETNGILYAIDARLGKQKKSYKIPGGISRSVDSTPSMLESRGNWLIFTAADQKIYAFPLDRKKKKWYAIAKEVKGAPLVTGDKIFAGDRSRKLKAFDFSYSKRKKRPRLKEIWKSDRLKYHVQSAPIALGKTIYVNAGRYIYAIDAGGKETKLLGKFSSPINRQTFAKDHTLYFSTVSHIHALSIGGKNLWKSDKSKVKGPFSAFPVVSKHNIVYIANEKGVLYALTAKTGKLLWKYNLNNASNSKRKKPKISMPPILIDDMVIQVWDKLYAFIDS